LRSSVDQAIKTGKNVLKTAKAATKSAEAGEEAASSTVRLRKYGDAIGLYEQAAKEAKGWASDFSDFKSTADKVARLVERLPGEARSFGDSTKYYYDREKGKQ